MFNILNHIPYVSDYTTASIVDGGWSNDIKYHVTTSQAEYLVRVSPIESIDQKKQEFGILQQIAALG